MLGGLTWFDVASGVAWGIVAALLVLTQWKLNKLDAIATARLEELRAQTKLDAQRSEVLFNEAREFADAMAEMRKRNGMPPSPVKMEIPPS